MTPDSLPERIQALLTQWQTRVDTPGECSDCASVLRRCKAELEALLASQASGWQPCMACVGAGRINAHDGLWQSYDALVAGRTCGVCRGEGKLPALFEILAPQPGVRLATELEARTDIGAVFLESESGAHPVSDDTTHQAVVDTVPQLRRGRVWCTTCGHTEVVDSAQCLTAGWPTHCGYTMTIDSPAERKRLSR